MRAPARRPGLSSFRDDINGRRGSDGRAADPPRCRLRPSLTGAFMPARSGPRGRLATDAHAANAGAGSSQEPDRPSGAHSREQGLPWPMFWSYGCASRGLGSPLIAGSSTRCAKQSPLGIAACRRPTAPPYGPPQGADGPPSGSASGGTASRAPRTGAPAAVRSAWRPDRALDGVACPCRPSMDGSRSPDDPLSGSSRAGHAARPRPSATTRRPTTHPPREELLHRRFGRPRD